MNNEPKCTCSSDVDNYVSHTANCFNRAFEQGRQEVLAEVGKAFDHLGSLWDYDEHELFMDEVFPLRKLVGRPAKRPE